MRLPLLDPAQMSEAQKALYDDIRSGIAVNFTAFKTIDDDTGALIGPWNAMLHEPHMGWPVWNLSKVTSAESVLPRPVREIAILVVGAHYKAPYELYAHTAVAKQLDMDAGRLSTLCSGHRPADLDAVEGIAYDVTSALMCGGVLPELCYRRAVELLGQRGLNELVYLVGLYGCVAVMLNAYDVPVPEA